MGKAFGFSLFGKGVFSSPFKEVNYDGRNFRAGETVQIDGLQQFADPAKADQEGMMREQERDQAQLELAADSCLVWEVVEEVSPKLSIAELVRAVCSYFYAVNQPQFAEATGRVDEECYLRFSRLATEIGDFPAEVLEHVVMAYGKLLEAEQEGMLAPARLAPLTGGSASPDRREDAVSGTLDLSS